MASVLMSGASGFIGSALAEFLAADGHRVTRLVRRTSKPAPGVSATVGWEPETEALDREALARAAPEVVVNLAGAPIAQRWTREAKKHIRASRVVGTQALARALTTLMVRPRVMLSGSAIGYYGAHRGDELLTEDSSAGGGSDFLAETAREWEQATAPAADAGIRVVLSRTGVVLGQHGGALARLLPPFKLGVGGRLGSGRQWMSWISLEDTVRALRFFIDTASVNGAVNVVAPAPARNVEFTETLARVLKRPAVFPVPATVLELMFGTMADNTILASQRVVPQRLADAGFEFRHPQLEDALRFELRRSDGRAGR